MQVGWLTDKRKLDIQLLINITAFVVLAITSKVKWIMNTIKKPQMQNGFLDSQLGLHLSYQYQLPQSSEDFSFMCSRIIIYSIWLICLLLPSFFFFFLIHKAQHRNSAHSYSHSLNFVYGLVEQAHSYEET